MADLNPVLTKYTEYVNAFIEGNLGFLSKLYNRFSIPNAMRNGPITIPVWSGATAVTPVDGTMLQNGMADASAVLTFTNQSMALSLPPSNEFTISNMDAQTALEMAAGAFVKNTQTYVILDAITATPGDSAILPHPDFYTSADATDLAIVDEGIAYVESVSGQDRANIYIAMHPKVYAKFKSLVYKTYQSAYGLTTGNIFTYDGIPVYAVSVNANDLDGSPISGIDDWGYSGTTPGEEGVAGIVCHKNAIACAYTPGGAYLHGGAVQYTPDGYIKLIWQSPFARGVISDDLIFHILNA
jgi:hypothetical protein